MELKRRIMVLTGKRGGFGAMKPMLRLMQCHPDIAVQLVVTDQRLNDHFGPTEREMGAGSCVFVAPAAAISSPNLVLGIAQGGMAAGFSATVKQLPAYSPSTRMCNTADASHLCAS